MVAPIEETALPSEVLGHRDFALLARAIAVFRVVYIGIIVLTFRLQRREVSSVGRQNETTGSAFFYRPTIRKNAFGMCGLTSRGHHSQNSGPCARRHTRRPSVMRPYTESRSGLK
jgi:hypothetical protein